jgi:hypothetical protein
MAWNLPDLISVANDRTVSWANKFKACFDVLSQHIHDGTDGNGAILTSQNCQSDISFVFPIPSGDFSSLLSPSISQYLSLYAIYTSGTSLGDTGTWYFNASEGIYTISVLYFKASNGGIVTITVNGSVIGEIDTYNSTNASGLTEFDDIECITGLNSVTVDLTGKNGSSSDYSFALIGFSFVRTDD